jgi:hypothetical protein
MLYTLNRRLLKGARGDPLAQEHARNRQKQDAHKKIPALEGARTAAMDASTNLRRAALPVVFFLVLPLSTLLLGLTGLATLLSALPTLLARSALSGLAALLTLLTTLLTVFLHIVCHEHSSHAVRGPAALCDFSLSNI